MKKVIYILSMMVFMLSQCTIDFPEDPKAPKWDLKITRIPLFKADTLRLGDKLKSDQIEPVGSDSILTVGIDNSKMFDLSDKLKFPAQSKSFSDELGEFQVDVDQAVESDIMLVEIFPQMEPALEDSAIVPPSEIRPPAKEMTLKDFLYVSIVSGGVMINLKNELGFAVDAQDNKDLYLDIIDVGQGNTIIETIEIQRIEDGETSSHYVDLSGKVISNEIKIELYGFMKGSEGEKVFISNNAKIRVTVFPDDFIVNEAQAKIVPQTLDLSGSIDINVDSLMVKSAEIESGSITFYVNNQFDFNIEIQIRFENLFDENNNPITATIPIPSKNDEQTIVDLANTLIDLDNKDLSFDVGLQIFPEPMKIYTLTSNDEFFSQVETSDIQFKSVTGDFNLTTSFPEIEEEVIKNPPDELESISFKDVQVDVLFINSPFDLDLNLLIEGVRNNQKFPLEIDEYLVPGAVLQLNRNGVNNDNSSPTIVDIINNIPEKLVIQGGLKVIGNDITFNKNDQVGVNYKIGFPFTFATNNAQFSNSDSLNIDDDMRDYLNDHTISAGLAVTVENGLPVSGNISMLVGADSLNITTEIFSFTLPEPVLAANGVVVNPGVLENEIELTEDQFLAIADGYFYKIRVDINDVSEATLTANDYIILKDIYMSGKVLFDPENLSDESDNGNN